jgi:hypothetical protein
LRWDKAGISISIIMPDDEIKGGRDLWGRIYGPGPKALEG